MRILITLLAFLMAATSMADTTYDYTGNNFAEIVGSLHTTEMSVDISVTLSEALGNNLIGFDVRPLITSFSVGDGVNVITDEDGSRTVEIFIVDTNASGEIIGWNWYTSWEPDIFIHSCTPSSTEGIRDPWNDSLCDILMESGVDWSNKYKHPGLDDYSNSKIAGSWVTVAP